MGMPRKKNKSPPVMSHEFIIQNHADILACIAIVIVMGLLSDITSKVSKLFIFLQYGLKNETELAESEPDVANQYERGKLDIFIIFFAALMLAVTHAVIQEYVIDKIVRKLHLSKMKNSKFIESCQVYIWCLISACWGAHIISKSGFIPNITLLWEGYPHTILEWETKIFLVCQIAYWLHMYPELYFQKTRKEDIPARIQYYTLYLVFITGAYILQFWRVAIVILTLHYTAEAVFHGSRICYYAEKNDLSKTGFKVWTFVFPIVRLCILSLSVVVFWFGLGNAENQGLKFSTGNFNSFAIRMTCLSSLCLLQVWLMTPFVNLQLKRSRDASAAKKKSGHGGTKSGRGKKNQKKGEAEVGNGASGKVKKN